MRHDWNIITAALARWRRGLHGIEELLVWGEANADVLRPIGVNPNLHRVCPYAPETFVKDLRAALTRHDVDPLITQYHALDEASHEYSRQRTGWRPRLVAATLGGDDFAPLDKVRWLWRCEEDEDSAGHWAAGARMAALNKHWNGQVPHNARGR